MCATDRCFPGTRRHRCEPATPVPASRQHSRPWKYSSPLVFKTNVSLSHFGLLCYYTGQAGFCSCLLSDPRLTGLNYSYYRVHKQQYQNEFLLSLSLMTKGLTTNIYMMYMFWIAMGHIQLISYYIKGTLDSFLTLTHTHQPHLFRNST